MIKLDHGNTCCLERGVSLSSWVCGYTISPQDPNVHVAHSPVSLMGKVRLCL